MLVCSRAAPSDRADVDDVRLVVSNLNKKKERLL